MVFNSDGFSSPQFHTSFILVNALNYKTASPERNSSMGAAMETVAEIWVKRTRRAGRRLEKGENTGQTQH